MLEQKQAAIETSLEMAGRYAVTTNVLQPSMTAQEVHDSYIGLQKLEHDFRAMKTGLLEVRPVFVRKKSRTRGHVLHAGTETESRDGAAATRSLRHHRQQSQAITLPDALTLLSHRSLLQYRVDEKTTVISHLSAKSRLGAKGRSVGGAQQRASQDPSRKCGIKGREMLT